MRKALQLLEKIADKYFLFMDDVMYRLGVIKSEIKAIYRDIKDFFI